MDKAIIFCVDEEHADRMRRELVNQNLDMVEHDDRYVMRITGSDDIGKNQLDNFINPRKKYPTIVTTSKLLTTGVDPKTVSKRLGHSDTSVTMEIYTHAFEESKNACADRFDDMMKKMENA